MAKISRAAARESKHNGTLIPQESTSHGNDRIRELIDAVYDAPTAQQEQAALARLKKASIHHYRETVRSLED